MSKPRTCKKCGTRISGYNPGPFCFAHTEGMPVKTHYPVSKCWSRNEPARVDRHPYSDGWYANLDKLKDASTESVTGVVINGNVEPIEKIMGFK